MAAFSGVGRTFGLHPVVRSEAYKRSWREVILKLSTRELARLGIAGLAWTCPGVPHFAKLLCWRTLLAPRLVPWEE